MVYDVKFPNGVICEYSENVIAEKMHAQVDTDGLLHDILNDILAFDKDEAEAV